MGVWDKVKSRVEEEISRRAAEAALKQGAEAARVAVKNAGRRLEEALFGDVEEEPERREPPPAEESPRRPEAKEALRVELEAAQARARAARERADREVEEELEALKKKVRAGK